MFQTVLVAGRGEIAVRIFRTLRRLGVTSVAVHTGTDTAARHVHDADLAVRVESYLSIESILTAARETGTEAVHPGYGFLAENSVFARACEKAGLVFVGPPASAIEIMGDKIRAKRTVAAAGIPVVPGGGKPGLSDRELAEEALKVGLPALLKPSAGGGGKGMRLVRDPAELPKAIAAARREARGAFGDDTLLVERFIDGPRHVEIQVFADTLGNVVHLGERECSLQRRHQKIIEEAPSPLLDETLRSSMGAQAISAARAVGYVGAGTVEFIVAGDRPEGGVNFMEMNTRLQVEHPVTELVTGYDLVEAQLRVAAGEPLPFTQDSVRLTGHAIEARIYAEDPARGFLPTGGRVLMLREPAARHVRVDSGIAAGEEIAGAYDPMLAKVIVWGEDRESAIGRLDRALASYTLLGVPSNVAFLRALLAHPDVAAGRLDTGLVERALPGLAAGLTGGITPDLTGAGRPDPVTGVPLAMERYNHVLAAAAALERMLALEPDEPGDPWELPDGWRLGEPAWTRWPIGIGGRDPVEVVEVRVRGRAADAEVAVAAGDPVPASARWDGPQSLVMTYGGRTIRYACARASGVCWLGHDGHAWALTEHPAHAVTGGTGRAASGLVRSPMPGTVLAVTSAEGERVTVGRPLVIVEAMKMEHTVVAPVDGVLARLRTRPGAQVALGETLAEIAPASSPRDLAVALQRTQEHERQGQGETDEGGAGGAALAGENLRGRGP